MRYVIDADLPRSASRLLEQHGHQAVDIRDIGLGNARDPAIAGCAHDQHAALLIGDFGFADNRDYPPEHYHGILVLERPPDADAPFIRSLIGAFPLQETVFQKLPGRLTIASVGRIRSRPA